MAEKMSVEEFFERVRKGEFMGATVTIVAKPITFTVEEAGPDDVWDEGSADRWFVGNDSLGLYEDYVSDVDHLVVAPKEGA